MYSKKEKLLFDAAKLILYDMCPPSPEHYFCKKYVDGTDEPRCTECWLTYLLAIINNEV